MRLLQYIQMDSLEYCSKFHRWTWAFVLQSNERRM